MMRGRNGERFGTSRPIYIMCMEGHHAIGVEESEEIEPATPYTTNSFCKPFLQI